MRGRSNYVPPRFAELTPSWGRRIDAVRTDLSARIDALDARIDAQGRRIDTLSGRIDRLFEPNAGQRS